jgi:hypothetical protein
MNGVVPSGTLTAAGTNTFKLGMWQSETDSLASPNYTFTGAELFYLTPNCSTVNAGPSVTIGPGCSTELNATPNLRGATYTWRNDATGQVVGNSANLIVSPGVTTVYEVEMRDFAYCYSYSTVTISVSGTAPPCVGRTSSTNNTISAASASEIQFSAYPNPFKNELSVTYALPLESKSGLIKIVDVSTAKVVYQAKLDTEQNKLDIKNIEFAPGLYICYISCDSGETKQFKLVNIK